jgi:hypothetical protein
MRRTLPAVTAGVTALLFTLTAAEQPFRPDIPKAWDEKALADMEIPLPPPAPKPVHVSEAYYYSIPELTIYRTYPRVPRQEDSKYVEWLKQQEPVVAFDPAQLQTEEAWIKAGQLVFNAALRPLPYVGQPFGASYVIRTKGVVEVTPVACSTCHRQRQPDGTLIAGAPSRSPSNFAFNFPSAPEGRAARMRSLYSTPWLDPDPNMQLDPAIAAQDVISWRTASGGINDRIGSSLTYPVRIPSLIGLKNWKYFDHSGRHRHRSIGDLMRYAAMADVTSGMERYQRYGDFIPGAADFKTLPDPKTLVRFSDAQLYALALYLYSLESPTNPNQPDALSSRGERVFQNEGCDRCHREPLYTNNRLIPAEDFTVPPEHRSKYDLLSNERIGVDSHSTLKTRRGTGYYKVPSLKDVWLRPVLGHNGAVGTLEEWFDPRRLEDSFVSTGFRGPHKSRAVKGHEFGLTLSTEERKALIAFLRIL